MAAIAITDCTVSQWTQAGGIKFVKIVTPATADDGDTIDVSTIFDVGCFSIVSGATDNVVLQATSEWAARSITIPGSTDNEARTILAFGH